MNDHRPIAIIAAALVLFVAGGAWWMSRRAGTPAANTTPSAVNATDAPIDKSGPPVVLPPLNEMDPFLRQLLATLSTRPELARWLATDDLIRQMAAAIDQASAGASPARDLKVLAPSGKFTAAGRGTRRTIDPASYRRYDGLVAAITSMEPAAVAKIYATIRPRLDEAYQGMGNRGGGVDDAVRQALDILLETPTVTDPIAIVEGEGAAWAFADPELESLTATQKQLLRMGPAHTEKLLAWLRAFRSALQ